MDNCIQEPIDKELALIDVRNITDDIIEVKETSISFRGAVLSYHYINMKDKTTYMHPKGIKVEDKDLKTEMFKPMDGHAMDWAMKYYIPKLGK